MNDNSACKSAKKILYLVTEDWYFCSHRLPLAVAAKQAGYEVVVATHVNDHGDLIRRSGLRLVPIMMRRRGAGWLHECKSFLEVIRLYLSERPDIVHQVALKPVVVGGVAAWLTSVPVVINAVAGLGYVFTAQGWKGRLLRPIFATILGCILSGSRHHVIVQNEEDAASLRAISSAIRLYLIRGAGVDMSMFRPSDADCENSSRPLRVILPARMIWDKGVGEFVEASRILKKAGISVRMTLVGDSDYGNPMGIPQTQLLFWQEEGIVDWWGRCEDMPGVYGRADIVCLPTYYREGLPKVLREAAASGLPVRTTYIPGCRDVVCREENG